MRYIHSVARIRDPRCLCRCSVRVNDLGHKGHGTLRGFTLRMDFMSLGTGFPHQNVDSESLGKRYWNSDGRATSLPELELPLTRV